MFIFQLIIMILKRLAVATAASVNITEVEMATLPLHSSVVQQLTMVRVPDISLSKLEQALVNI